MYDDDKSIDVQLICNQRVVTYNKLWGMNPIVLIEPCDDSLDIIYLNPVKNARD